MKYQWETRYSSAEMMFVSIGADGKSVEIRLNSNAPDVYSAEQVEAGAIDNEIGAVFGRDVLDEIKAALQKLRR